MHKLTVSEIQSLAESKSEQEWNTLCGTIKKKYGDYPSDWFEKIMASGLSAAASRNWAKDKS